MDPRIEQKVRLTARRYAPGDQAFEDLAVQTAFDESRGRQKARSPKGAIGVMQLMPGTASDMGVDPHNEDQNIDGGVRYLFRQYRDFGDPKLARAAYNAGPGAVRKYGGVPPYAETQKYVGGGNVAKMPSAEELLTGGADAPTGAPQQSSAMPSAADLLTPTKPAPVPQRAPARTSQGLGFQKGILKPLDNVTTWMDGGQGLTEDSPLAKNIVAYRKATPNAPTIPSVRSLVDAAKASIASQEAQGVRPGKLGEFAGNVAGTAWVPGGPVMQGMVSGALLTDNPNDAGGVARDTILGGVGGRLGAAVGDAAQLTARRLLSKAPQIPKLPELEAIKRGLYDQVEKSGFTFGTPDVKNLAATFTAGVRQMGGPKAAQLVPGADAMAARLEALANQKGGVTLSQLDRLRSDIYDTLISKGGAEAKMGYDLRRMIDGLMDSTKAPFIRAAREANTRWEKVSDITRRMTSAELGAATANSGQNVVNRTRQKIRPTIDPMSSDMVRNYTPDEAVQVGKIVNGTPLTNGLRNASNLARNKIVSLSAGLLGNSVGGPWAGIAVGTGVEGIGQTLRGIGQRVTKGQIDDLINLMAVGGDRTALKAAMQRIPTRASYNTEKLISLLRPYLATAGAAVPSMAAAKPKPAQKK